MNEVMIAMAREAGCVEASHPFNPWSVSQDALNRLGELIVQECASIIKDAVDHREPASTYADKIKKHFGVEE